MDPDPIVTTRDIYNAVMSLSNRVASLEGSIKPAIEAKADHEARLRSLERIAYAIPASVVASLTAIAVAFLKAK